RSFMRDLHFIENMKIALRSVRAQMLRTVLTALIIVIGIMALVGILTAIDSIKGSLSGQFALLGANTFSIQNKGPNIQIGRGGEKPKIYAPISFYQAQKFKETFTNKSALVSVSYIVTGAAEVGYLQDKTDPNITIWAADENYLKTGGYEIA